MIAATLLLASHTAAEEMPRMLATPISLDHLDAASFAEWSDGAEKLIRPEDAKDKSRLPQWLISTEMTTPGHSGLRFGDSQRPGPRHLRIGFKQAVPVGSVLIRGGGQLSVLRHDVPFPGDLANDAHWIPAQRLVQRVVSRQEVAELDFGIWTLPANLTTRALRLTHHAELADKSYAGFVGGLVVLTDRLTNIAPQADALGSTNDKHAFKLINERNDPGEPWCNISLKEGDRAQAISAKHLEWAMLVWPTPVKLRGLGAFYAGFATAEAQVYSGPQNVHPREAPESSWTSVKTFTGLKNRYPSLLPIDWIVFGNDVTTRAVRLRITASFPEGGHPHVQSHPRQGKRVWLGDLLALTALDKSELATAILAAPSERERPPIPIHFTMPEDGFATLVIEDQAGKRVRNLLADTFFVKGEHTAGWDGSDDLGRDVEAAKHGLYAIPTQLVSPDRYTVRGLWRRPVHIKYEMGIYTAGDPPWETADKSGGWLANHSPPSAVLYVPDVPGKGPTMLIGSYVSEGCAGLAWVNLQGRRWKGQNWVGGNWTGAPYLARDAEPKRLSEYYAYVASAWSSGKLDKKMPQGEIRITALTAKEDVPVLVYPFTPRFPQADAIRWETQIGGLAAHDGILAVSLTGLDRILLVDVRSGKVISENNVPSPRGVAFDREGRLLALSGSNLLHFAVKAGKLAAPVTAVEKLRDPQGVVLSADNKIYVSEHGDSHQIKVFSSEGVFLSTIGKRGSPRAGTYDPLHLNHPRGLTFDAKGRLWVAEEDSQPKRISVWNADGSLAQTFYGPAEYAGGGIVDPVDSNKLYYHGMEFKLDRVKRAFELTRVFYRSDAAPLKLAFRSGVPESAIYVEERRYFHNSFNSSPTGGHATAFIFADREGSAVPVAACGRASDWKILQEAPFQSLWPTGTFPKDAKNPKPAFFLWSDRNDDGQVQPDEVAIAAGASGGVTVLRDLSFAVARFDGKAMSWPPQGFSAKGTPKYDIAKFKLLAEGAQGPASSGGDQILIGPEGWSIHTTAPKPFKAHGIGGAKNGVPMWTYPSMWPGLHASHSSPPPDRPGMIVGHTRLVGDFIHPKGSEPMWLLNSNHGPIYVFTADGLFVAQLFQDMRLGKQWKMPRAEAGMLLDELTPSDENFWPSVTQSADGAVYLCTGRPNALARVYGLESVRRLPSLELNVSADDLHRCREYFVRIEAERQAKQGRGTLRVALRPTSPKVDGDLTDWRDAEWVDIDRRGARAYFNADTKPYNVTGALAVADGRLYAAWRTGDKNLLENSGEVPSALFKSGGCLDLMIGVNPEADPKRTQPGPGDIRLLITRVAGKTRALLFHPVTPDKAQPVPFSSPSRTITFDRVDDVSDQVQLAFSAHGDYEIAFPLAALGLQPKPGLILRGDMGILRGSGGSTIQRVYWSNKATAIVADVPSEAELRPQLWGRVEFVTGPS